MGTELIKASSDEWAMAKSKDLLLRSKVASQTSDPEIQRYLASDKDHGIKKYIAERTNDVDAQRRLARDSSSHIRAIVAGKVNDPKLQEELAKDLSEQVRRKLAEKTQNPKVLESLARDVSTNVRVAVAGNTSDKNLALFLSKDQQPGVRAAIAKRSFGGEIDVLLSKDKDREVKQRVALYSKDLEAQKNLVNDPDPTIVRYLATSTSHDEIHEILKKHPDANIRTAVAKRTKNPQIHQELAKDPSWGVRQAIADNSSDPEILRSLYKDPDNAVRDHAEKGLVFHDPDHLHNESVNVKMGVSKLRKLRDIIQGQGRSEAHPKELPAGDWNKARLPNGNISADKLQQIIDLQPGVKYNISHGEWSGVQRHNDEHSKVFQLNLSTDTVNKLKAAGPGVYDTFRKMHEDAKNDQHPTGKGGLGWVRYTGNPKDGIFIDEVQSDLGQSFVKQAANQAKQKQQQEQGQQQEQIQFPEEHYQKIKDIVFQGKHPNEVLHEAFQEYLRTNKKAIGSDIHVWSPESKASISLSDEGGKIPGHMQITYGDIPKKMGMEPKTYGELFTQDNYDYEREKKATFGDIIRKSSIRSQKCVFIWCEDWAGNVLWGKRHDGKYSLPGGHVNESEDFHIAAVRELQEETNVVPDVMTEIGIAHGGKYNEVLIYIYKAIGRGDPTSQFDPDREFSDVFWVDCRSGIPIEIMRNLAHPRNVVLELLGYQQPDIFTKSQKDPEVSSIDPYHVPKYENHGIKDLHNHWQVTENEHHLDHPKNKYLLRTIGKSIAKMIGAANPEGHEGVRVDPNLPDPTTKAYYDEGYSYVSPQDAINISKTFSKSDENKLQHGHSIKALLHEALHGASEKHRYEEGSSKALEEASTEILANHYTPQVMAHSAGVAVPKSPPMFSADKEGVFPTYSTAYMGWCSKLAQVVGCIEGLDKPGINEEEHAKKLTDAVVHYSYKLKKTPNREDFLIKSLLKKRLNLDPPSTEDKNHPYFKAYNSLANQLFGLNSLPVGGKMAGGMFHRSKTLTRRKIHIILDNARKAYNKEWV
jgi:8-oxo-dGTP pyrophosphatase MutT (NUDIX family)